jgi:1,4-alpha-glucan branching enzyme
MQQLVNFTLSFLLLSNLLPAQVVYTEPFFPKADQPVTVFFDASKGTAGLKDCACDVYLHTGVVTNQSNGGWKYVKTTWGQANPAWRMTPVSGKPNLYSYLISPSVRSYYGVPGGETIEKLAFVFRNATGSREGKETGGADIFYPVYPANQPFTALLLSPTSSSLVRAIGETIAINLVTSENAAITLSDNGTQLTQTTGTMLNYTLNVTTAGTHTVEIKATSGTNTQTVSFSYAVPANLPLANPPAGTQLGATFLENDTKVRLALHAPGKKNVFVIGDFNNWQPSTDYQMTKSVDGNTFWIEIGGLTSGQNYTYQYLVDGTIRVADPLSTLILDANDDPFIPNATYPNLPPYPKDKTTGNVTLLQPGAPKYNWNSSTYQRPAKEKLVIYELLVRDFVARHDYATLIDTLNYLQRLGVNAIELMPVSEFEGNISWGYNVSFHQALDKYYGTINEFKRFVEACHNRGIAVILDVVYNHAFGESPLAQLYWDGANNRPAADNPWLNPIARHPFNVGFDFNHESTATRAYVDQTLRYWLSEFRIDGFRFDLSKGFTQRQSSDDSQFRLYDPARIATLKHYADVVWATTPGAYVILEHFAENSEDKELADYGAMLWAGAGVHNQYLEAAMGYPAGFNDASYKSRSWNQPHLITYIESHDEERLVYKNVQFGNASGSYNVKTFPTALRRAELTNAFFYTIPGPKMLWQFGELGYDFSINYCQNGTINNGCRTDPKPIRWDYAQDADRRRLYDVTRDLIHLKKNYESFNTTNFTLNTANLQKTIHLTHPSMDVAVQGNFGVNTAQIPNAFPKTGWWYEYFTGDSVLINSPTQSLSFAPGEYRLYTTRKVGRPSQMTTGTYEVVKDYFKLTIAPNPTSGAAQVTYTLPQSGLVQLQVFNALGQQITTFVNTKQAAGTYTQNIQALPPGTYWLRLTVDDKLETKQLMVVQ